MRVKLSMALMLLGLLVVLVPFSDPTAEGAAHALARVDMALWEANPLLVLQLMEIELAQLQNQRPVPVIPADLLDYSGRCVWYAILIDADHIVLGPTEHVVDTLVHEHRHLMQLRGLPGGAELRYNLYHYHPHDRNQPVERDAYQWAGEVVELWEEILERR